MAFRQPAEPIAPQPLAGAPSIVTAARLNPALSVRQGVQFSRSACGQVHGFACDCETPQAELCETPGEGCAEFGPFTIYDLERCPEGVFDAADLDVLAGNSERLVADGTAWALSRELEQGTLSEWDNPTLCNTAVDLTSGSAVAPVDGLAVLIRALVNVRHGRGMLHVPMAVIPSLLEQGLLTLTAGLYRGPGGMVVSPGPGYQGVQPGSCTDLSDAGVFWLYATASPVEYNVGAVVQALGSPVVDPDTNVAGSLAWRQAVLRFDPCNVFAVAVCAVHESCCGPIVVPPPEPAGAPAGLAFQADSPPGVGLAAEPPGPEAAAPDPAAVADVVDGPPLPPFDPGPVVTDPPPERVAVPTGTVEEIIEQVGGSPDLARAALDAEHRATRPRTTLIAALEDLIDG